MTLPPLMTVAEVATYLRFSPETVREWCRAGRVGELLNGRAE